METIESPYIPATDIKHILRKRECLQPQRYRPLTSLRFHPPFFFLTVFGEGIGESSWLSLGGIDAVDVLTETSTADEASLWLYNEAILLSM